MFKDFTLRCFLYGVVAGMTLGVCTMRYHRTPYVYVDMGKVISHISQNVVKESSQKPETRIAEYKAEFQRLSAKYARENDVVVFSSPRPISASRDITDWVIGNLDNISRVKK